MSKALDQEADAIRREALAPHYPTEVIAPWSSVPEEVRDKYRAKVKH